jgi:hypothetical protein
MAKKPKIVSNIMDILGGRINIPQKESPKAGDASLMPTDRRSEVILQLEKSTNHNKTQATATISPTALIGDSIERVRSRRIENRRALLLNPDVQKAADLMVASCFAPNDLNCTEVPVTVTLESIDTDTRTAISDFLTKEFERRLDLSVEAMRMAHDFMYKEGAVIKMVIPASSVDDLLGSASGLEDLKTKIDSESKHGSLFGFGDEVPVQVADLALESIIPTFFTKDKVKDSGESAPFSEFATEALKKVSFTDNVSVVTGSKKAKQITTAHVKNRLYARFGDNITASLDPPDPNAEQKAEPMVLSIPTESVTVIHTPGDATSHIGYLILLDNFGNPIDTSANDFDNISFGQMSSGTTGSLINQTFNAYGMGTTSGVSEHHLMAMNAVYNRIMINHINQRLSKSGFGNSILEENESMLRCMFSRFLGSHDTRVLFVPASLITYMAIEFDGRGYGVSMLEGVKHSLSLYTAVNIARVTAAIKSATDRRKISAQFTDNMNIQPEQFIQNVQNKWIEKSSYSFGLDPRDIVRQIASKSITFDLKGIPGIEDFSISNEPDSKSASFDFDADVDKRLKDDVLSGMKVPPAAMNNLGEEEYSRSVVTSNLFFNMTTIGLQRYIKKAISPFLVNIARWSPSIRKRLEELLSSGDGKKTPKQTEVGTVDDSTDHKSKLDEVIDSIVITLPRPNIAPTESQFKVFGSMSEAVTAMVNAVLPDDLIGSDDRSAAALKMLRSSIIRRNIINFMTTSGMTGIDIPATDFSGEHADMVDTLNALTNINAMLDTHVKVTTLSDSPDTAEGY